MDPEEVLLEGFDEALGDTAAFGLADKGTGAPDSKESISAWKSWAMKLLPWSWRSLRPWATPPAKAPEAGPDGLADGLHGLEAVSRRSGMDADAFGPAVIDGHLKVDVWREVVVDEDTMLRASPHAPV